MWSGPATWLRKFVRSEKIFASRSSSAGVGPNDLVKTTTYVTDIDEFFRHPEVRAEIFGQSLPTSTTVEVRRLSHPDLMVEIEAIAVIDQ